MENYKKLFEEWNCVTNSLRNLSVPLEYNFSQMLKDKKIDEETVNMMIENFKQTFSRRMHELNILKDLILKNLEKELSENFDV